MDGRISTEVVRGNVGDTYAGTNPDLPWIDGDDAKLVIRTDEEYRNTSPDLPQV